MACFYCGKTWNIDRKWSRRCLAVCWIAGLLCGIYWFFPAAAPITSLMRRTLVCSVSIVSLFGIYFIPFLFTAFAVFISELRLLFLVCFCKGCLYSFVSLGIYAAYGSSGWMIRGLLLLGDSMCVLALYLLWGRLLSGRLFDVYVDTIGFALVCVLACVVDYYIISPFLAGLINI